FLDWVKKTLVDGSVQRYEGQMIYTFSLKRFVPFLYGLLAAEKVANLSARRCDEILVDAIRDLDADPDLMTSAAALYPSDKTLAAVTPPASLRDSSHLVNWQVGVIQATLPKVMTALAAGR